MGKMTEDEMSRILRLSDVLGKVFHFVLFNLCNLLSVYLSIYLYVSV